MTSSVSERVLAGEIEWGVFYIIETLALLICWKAPVDASQFTAYLTRCRCAPHCATCDLVSWS